MLKLRLVMEGVLALDVKGKCCFLIKEGKFT